VPHPPLLHAVIWKSPSKSVFINDSELVGGHSNGHLVPTFTNYNFTGQAAALLICLGNLPYCLPLKPIWKSALLWNDTQFLDKKLEFSDFSAPEPYNATHWTVMTNAIPGTPIREPHGNNVYLLLPMAINVTGYKLVYWSYNGTSETNITGYWTTPRVGPDRGTI
jgi:hypothetical protein